MTLLEITVVLFIGALITAVVIPQAMKMIGAWRGHGQRSEIVQQLNELSLKAYVHGHGFELNNKTAPKVPKGWSLEVLKPIHFANNGMCTSGRVRLVAPDGAAQVYAMGPPDCHLKTK
ncbi:type II secretion system protein [Salinisphaera sp. RV14]|uniref:type II secretion system protein n=1 Tax=Salinisphaera sp. RV14 TaxID=3454140 RepID=UPI003F86A42A